MLKLHSWQLMLNNTFGNSSPNYQHKTNEQKLRNDGEGCGVGMQGGQIRSWTLIS